MLVSIEKLHGGWSRCPPWHQQAASVSHGLCCNCQQVKFSFFTDTDWTIISMLSQTVTFGAFCCSSLTRWYSRVVFQTPNEELIDGFSICFMAALQNYYKVLKRKQAYTFSCSTSRSYIPNTHLIGHLCKCLRCRRTTSSLTRSWCIETACRRGSWASWSSTRFRSWSSVSGPFPATLQNWLSSWSKNASAPPFTPVWTTTLARLHLELFWITPLLTGTGWF